VPFRQPSTINHNTYSAVYCFQNLYVLEYFVRLLIFRQGIVYERMIWYWIDTPFQLQSVRKQDIVEI